MSKTIYLNFHNNFFDNIIVNKRKEIHKVIYNNLNFKNIKSVLDVGATEDNKFKSSNYLTKKFGFIKNIFGLSDQNVKNKFYRKIFKKSITSNFSFKEYNKIKCDFVISNAVIEHVGSYAKQQKMIQNITKLSKKYFVIQTPNRYHPIEFHTKVIFIHWLPKNIFRKILKALGMVSFSKEKNLNLISEKDINKLFKKYKDVVEYKIFKINFLGFTSNFVIIGKIIK